MLKKAIKKIEKLYSFKWTLIHTKLLISMDYFNPQKTFQALPLAISFGNFPFIPHTTATFKKEYGLYYTR